MKILKIGIFDFGEHSFSVRGSRKPKTRHKDMLKVLLLDLYVAWTTDPELSIGLHLDNNEWKAQSRYNALHLSKVSCDQAPGR